MVRRRAQALWGRKSVRVLAALVVLAALAAGANAAATHLADSVTIRVWTQRSPEACPSDRGCAPKILIFDRTLHDAGTVSAVQDMVNTRVPFEDLGFTLNARGMCNALADPVNFYELSFQRFGVSIQVASVNTWCPWWDIRTLGVPAVGRFGGSPDVLLAIAQLTHMPPPPPGGTYGT